MTRILFLIFLSLGIMQCTTEQEPSTTHVRKTHILDTIPSGSGMSIVNDIIYIVGDDSPYLYQLNNKYIPQKQHLMVADYPIIDGRIPKKAKPDFECIAEILENGEVRLLVFGSGSKEIRRDVLVKVNPLAPENPDVYSLTPFYKGLLELTGSKRKKMNIEGAVVVEEKLYLFNRGENGLFILELKDFMDFIHKRKQDIHMKYHKMNLPSKGGVQAGFSGACMIPGTSKILFTASLENTSDSYNDGEVLGSYIGIIDIKNPTSYENISLVTDENGSVVIEKLESVAFKERSENGNVSVLAASDNDDGKTTLLEIEIRKEFFPKKPID